jgi:iron(II)-dependent oxidoreductase
MHAESILYNKNLLTFLYKPIHKVKNTLSGKIQPIPITFIEIKGCQNFLQGAPNDGKNMVWDNELTRHPVKINDFSVSKYPITMGQFLHFVDEDKYNQTSGNWSYNGKLFLRDSKAKHPIYWNKINDIWHVCVNNNWCMIKDTDIENWPIYNISWYEAEAYCNWANLRLITESEWEYIATECGTIFTIDYDAYNMDYRSLSARSVTYSPLNKLNIGDMFGNVWCWCEDAFKPYPNFNIDPLYKEFSYPFFGYKNILRGGCFATPRMLINQHYRNAQPPNTRKQFAGFRVCKK